MKGLEDNSDPFAAQLETGQPAPCRPVDITVPSTRSSPAMTISGWIFPIPKE